MAQRMQLESWISCSIAHRRCALGTLQDSSRSFCVAEGTHVSKHQRGARSCARGHGRQVKISVPYERFAELKSVIEPARPMTCRSRPEVLYCCSGSRSARDDLRVSSDQSIYVDLPLARNRSFWDPQLACARRIGCHLKLRAQTRASNPTGLIALCGAIDFQLTMQLFDPVLHFASGEPPAVHHAQREIVDSHLHASIVQVAGYCQKPERIDLKHGGRAEHVAHRSVQSRMLGL
jgi:hypothetical protein